MSTWLPGASRHVAAFLLAGTLCACASGNDETLSALMVSPGKYEIYKCDQLAKEGKDRVSRAQELRKLMGKSSAGPGGALANTLAYRSEYLTAVGELREMEKTALGKKCEVNWLSDSDRSMF
ncbi:MAG: hypothetical protein AB7K04_00430 [Pseudorhodoplanes sp.]